jgi:hypothetical protein
LRKLAFNRSTGAVLLTFRRHYNFTPDSAATVVAAESELT